MIQFFSVLSAAADGYKYIALPHSAVIRQKTVLFDADGMQSYLGIISYL
jgi:hypothetical protein